MKYVRVRSYLDNKLIADHAYGGDNQSNALSRFRKEYPEHDKCILIAETIDDTDPKYSEWFRVARNCDCVHFF